MNKISWSDPYYGRQYRELDDVNAVLSRSNTGPNKHISLLKAANESPAQSYTYLSQPPETYLDFSDPVHVPLTRELKELVLARSPINGPYVVEREGQYYYQDREYERGLLPVEFARDPAAFKAAHPEPQYIWRRS